MENPQESSMTVISAGLDSCLQHWMKTQRREINFTTYPGAKKNRVIPQPLGVVGVIVPWNFPLHLV